MTKNFEKTFYTKLHERKHRVILSITSSVIRSILILIPTLLMRNIYNALELGLDAKGVLGAILMTFVLPVIVAVAFSVDIRLSKYLFVIIKEIRVQALANILQLKLRSILSKNKSDLFNRIVVSLEELGDYYYYFLNTSTWYITTTVVGIGLMLYINYQITLVLLVFVALQIGCSLVIQKRIERTKELENRLQAEGCDYLLRIVEHHSFVLTALLQNRESGNLNHWIKNSWKAYGSAMLNKQITAFLSFLITLLRTLYLFFAVHYLFLNGSMLKGDFIALNSYIVWLSPVFLGLQESIQDIIAARANKRRVNAYLEETAEEEQQVLTPDTPMVRMEAANLAFAYDDAQKQLFSDLSFNLKAGETLFIVGASGSGKSTLLNLLLNLETGYTGRIAYNGCDLKTLDDDWLHQNAIMVGQDVDILPTTFRDNILYSGREATDQEIIETLRALKIDYLLDMPGGLDWDMKANPCALSDGEKKRIAIARAVLSKPAALFLDEPTAGLDNINKMDMMRFIEKKVKGILVVVTHDVIFTDASKVLRIGRA